LSDQRPAGVTEADAADALGGLAATAHTLLRWVELARPLMERLAEDYPPAALLAQSLATGADPAYLGTPRHLEEAAAALLRDLGR
jgi:hypothetical protein